MIKAIASREYFGPDVFDCIDIYAGDLGPVHLLSRRDTYAG